MAIHINSKVSLNNMERNQGVAVFELDVSANKLPRGGEIIPYEEGDTIVLGHLPEKAMLEAMYMDLNKVFPAGTTLDVLLVEYNGTTLTPITDIALGVVVDGAGGIIHLPLPLTRNLNADGTPYVGASPILKSDSAIEAIALTVHGSSVTSGKLRMIIPYSYIGVKGTGVYLS